MAAATVGLGLIGATKLPGVDIRMAGGALLARRMEHDGTARTGRGRLVAAQAGRSAMLTQKLEAGPAVVERRRLPPVPRSMALIA